MKKTENIKRKLAILAGLSVSLTSCGTNNTDEPQNETKATIMNTTAVVQEIDEKDVKVESVEETTNEKGETVKVSEGITENGEKVKITETTNEKGEKVKIIETTNDKGETVKVTEKTDSNGNVTEKEEIKKPKTEIETEPKTEQTTTIKANTNVKTTTIQTTAKPVVTTTQTAKPIVTTQAPEPVTQAPTKPIKTNFTKYDLLDQDPEVAARAFDKLASDMCNELYRGYSFDREYGWSNGYSECKVMLATLNYNQGISPEVLASNEALGSFSEQEVFNYSHTIGFSDLENTTGARVDFRKYVLNDDLANFINTANNEWINAYNGNDGAYEQLINNYYGQYNDISEVTDFVKYYFAVCADYNLDRMPYEGVEEAEQLYDENIVGAIYDSYVQYKGHSYTR